MNKPLVLVVGKTNSGKTTLVEKLVPELVARKYKVATIKHCSHDFEIDYPGKDSFRHRAAGASTSIVASKEKVALVKNIENDMSLDNVINSFVSSDTDIIIAEGYKNEHKPKIEVIKDTPICTKEELIAVVARERKDFGLPCFLSDEIKKIADFIEEKIIRKGKINVSV